MQPLLNINIYVDHSMWKLSPKIFLRKNTFFRVLCSKIIDTSFFFISMWCLKITKNEHSKLRNRKRWCFFNRILKMCIAPKISKVVYSTSCQFFFSNKIVKFYKQLSFFQIWDILFFQSWNVRIRFLMILSKFENRKIKTLRVMHFFNRERASLRLSGRALTSFELARTCTGLKLESR